MAIATHTEWYRCLSRWEPYSKDLWLLQVRLYGEICQAAPEAMHAAYNLAYRWRDDDPEKNKPLDHTYKVAKAELDALGIQARIFLAPRFNEIYTKFDHKVFMLSADTQSAPNWRLATDRDSDEMYALFGQLLEAARASVCTDALGRQSGRGHPGRHQEQLIRKTHERKRRSRTAPSGAPAWQWEGGRVCNWLARAVPHGGAHPRLLGRRRCRPPATAQHCSCRAVAHRRH